MLNFFISVDGYWNDWNNWEICNVTCGGGIQQRSRTCVEPLYGGADCTGPDTDYQACNTQSCPGQDQNNIHILSISAFLTQILFQHFVRFDKIVELFKNLH